MRIKQSINKKDRYMKKALVLAGGLPQIELIKELQQRGYFVILADYYENPIARDYADRFYQKSTLDVEAMRAIAVEEKVDMIITCCTDQALAVVSRLSEELGLPCYVGTDIGLWVTNKQYMKDIFRKNGIPTASHQIVKDYSEVESREYPLIVKPVDCNSSKGVVKVRNDEELKAAVETAVEFSRTNTAVVEQFIDGKEISVDLFVTNGKAKVLCLSCNEKIPNDKKFIIYKNRCLYEGSDELRAKIEKVGQQIVDAFGLKNCPMLIQLLNKDDDIWVIEFSARTGGCVKYRMIELVSGVNIIKATVDLFENKLPELAPYKSPNYVANEFIYCENGEFSHFEGFEECKQAGIIENYYPLKTPGMSITGVNSSGDRIAAVTFVGDSYEDYVRRHNEFITKAKVINNLGEDMMRHDLLPEL